VLAYDKKGKNLMLIRLTQVATLIEVILK